MLINLATARAMLADPATAPERLPAPVADQLAVLACERLQIETLEVRGRDHLDFADVHVAAVRQLLAEVYALGVAGAFERGRA